MGSPPNVIMASAAPESHPATPPKRLRNVFATVPSESHPLYRTKICRNFTMGCCTYGDKCAYIHAIPSQLQTSIHLPAVVTGVPKPYGLPPYPMPTVALPVPVPSIAPRKSHDRLEEPSTPPVPPCTPVYIHKRLPSEVLATVGFSDPDCLYEGVRRPRKRARAATMGGKNHYRTKPCRFFSSPEGCVKGDKCNFMHDPAIPWTPESALNSRKRSVSSCPSDVSSQVTPLQEHCDLPKMSGRATSESVPSNKKDYYPINWRVIGGGVMMSGRRDVCHDYMRGLCSEGPDCKFAHSDHYGGAQEHELPVHKFAPERPPLELTYGDGPLYSGAGIGAAPIASPSAAVKLPLGPANIRKPRARLVLVPPSHEEFVYNFHRILDGQTLFERAIQPQEEQCIDSNPSDDPHYGASNRSVPLSPRRDNPAFAIRSITRPLSTPPAIPGSAKVERLFAAESP
ncbi:hypothetical protein BXZ70DRAFT_409153 [Cristinia sonorae]|uniref:C3H1-type domain-containing protein n=1 Tax=Cristinia sonorae TaxID=1940300 RepID=A0A8K0XTN1_9AGAR|nr:hypothetical protein BXZ70DRAFT_409153 [Cristinia sonorae]